MVAIILAAGEGTRMRSNLPKVLHKLGGRPMIDYIVDALDAVGAKRKIVVIGYKSAEVSRYLKGRAEVVLQKKRLGTADAVKAAQKMVGRVDGNILVMCADTPLVTKETIGRLVAAHKQAGASCTILSANMKNPTGYGRIERDSKGRILRIVEEQEADIYQKAIEEINVGAYCFNSKALFSNLAKIKPSVKKKEYYLTDLVGILAHDGNEVAALALTDNEEALGVNSRADLARASQVLKERTISKLQGAGVTIVDPATTYIANDVTIGQDTVVYPMTTIEQGVSIGASCEVGPCARLRTGSAVDDNVTIGNFVELARTKIGRNTRVQHNAYLGDARVGRGVNIGAGTITANYDGKAKNKTIIDDGAFIGSGTILIAPIRIGRNAVTGAGAVITKGKDVPASATVVGIPARIIKRRR